MTAKWRRKNMSMWTEWQDFSFNVPAFYNSYADLSSLASALGGQLGDTPISLGNGETHTITGLTDVTILEIKKSDGDGICLVLKSWTHCVVLGDTDLYVTTDVEGKVCLTASAYGISIKNNTGGTSNFRYSIVKRVS